MHLSVQYDLVKSARAVLLAYCATVTPDDFLRENSSFGRGSIRNLLVHNAFTYHWWIGSNGLGEKVIYPEYTDYVTLAQVIPLFDKADGMMARFIDRYEANPMQTINASLRDDTFATTPLALFTHAVTHEFHHKGQILSLSRHLGYTPVDTDVIR